MENFNQYSIYSVTGCLAEFPGDLLTESYCREICQCATLETAKEVFSILVASTSIVWPEEGKDLQWFADTYRENWGVWYELRENIADSFETILLDRGRTLATALPYLL